MLKVAPLECKQALVLSSARRSWVSVLRAGFAYLYNPLISKEGILVSNPRIDTKGILVVSAQT